VIAPVATSTPAVPPVQPITPAKPLDLGKPVETGTLGAIDAESTGLFSPAEGGLGSTLWKGTSRAVVEKVLPHMGLPTQSAVLNNLAQRLLLTIASVPEGPAGTNPNLTSMRLERLLALGDVTNAWKYAASLKSGQVDETTLRLLSENALLTSEGDAICAKLPATMQTYKGSEWQKLLAVCQLRAKDAKASQLTLDLLRTQGVKDETFFYLAEKNINGTAKQLPRQLTPLKPLTLALLRIVDQPLPGEVYVRPDAALVPELLKIKSRDEMARLSLAERMAERGLMSAADLSAVYKTVVFAPEAFNGVASSAEKGPRLHALLYQAALQDKTAQGRINNALLFLSSSSGSLISGVGAQILVDMLGDVKPAPEFNAASGGIAHIYTLAGKADVAQEWLRQAKQASIGMPPIKLELQMIWPLTVLAGLVPDAQYKDELNKWIDTALQPVDGKDERATREQIGSVLMLLDAAGFSVPDLAWAKIIDAPVFDKKVVPSAFYYDRLRAAAQGNRRGETVLFTLALTGKEDAPLLTDVEVVRSLRAVGLTTDAIALAREAVTVLMTPPVKL
ncbi:MAG: hypothetical protein WAO98_08230, partial [Alphaproteobacteria bacterium]